MLECRGARRGGIITLRVEYVEKLYNRYSRYYDFIFGKVFESGREMAPRLLDLFPGCQLLEVGVGTGLSLPMFPSYVQITGIDLSQKMLDRAKKRALAENLAHVRLLKMDATSLDFPDNSFDRVLAAYFISTVPDPVRVIQEMKRVCRPGGYLVFLNHFQHEQPILAFLEKHLSPLFYRIGFRTDLVVEDLMGRCGLEIESLEPVDFLGHWKAVRCINPA